MRSPHASAMPAPAAPKKKAARTNRAGEEVSHQHAEKSEENRVKLVTAQSVAPAAKRGITGPPISTPTRLPDGLKKNSRPPNWLSVS